MSDTPRTDSVVKAGESLTNTSALSELAMLARTLERELANYENEYYSACDEVTDLKRELAVAEKDAERYRFIRDPSSPTASLIIWLRDDSPELKSSCLLDKAVDAYISGPLTKKLLKEEK